MRVVYVTDARLPTQRAHGVQIARMCDALAGIGADVTLVHGAVRRKGQPSVHDYYGLRNEVRTVGVPAFDLSWLRSSSAGRIRRPLFSGYRVIWETAAWLRCIRMKTDLFIMRNTTPYMTWLLAKTGHPTLIEFHSQPTSISLKLHRSSVKSRGRKATIAVTDHLARTVESDLRLDEGVVQGLHDAVDVERFAPSANAPAREISVLYVGSLQKNRGVDVLVSAAALMPDVDFTIVGGADPELSQYRQQAEQMGATNVKFTGHIPPSEVPEMLHRARVVVMPMTGTETHTRYHASPLKLFEYMASGTPIVASDLPSVQEVVQHGVTAHLVTPDDPAALAEGIRQVLGDEEYGRTLGTAAMREAENYSLQNRARTMLAAAGFEIP